MILGIVGAEGAKFTQQGEEVARETIRRKIREKGADGVVSGGCHLGGIDIWAKEEAEQLGIPVTEFIPAILQWEPGYGKIGYKRRNQLIAQASTEVMCIAVRSYHAEYRGARFGVRGDGVPNCYHCPENNLRHVKSGGCWTTKEARRLGKPGYTIVIDP